MSSNSIFEQFLPSVDDDLHQQQLKHLQHLRRVCANETDFKNAMYKKQSLIKYYSSPKYNFNYCKVYKAGCTFWTEVFAILRKGASEDVFLLSRHDVHFKLGKQERMKVSNGAKIRNLYNQVPHLTQDTNGKVTNSQKTPHTRAKRSALSQQVTTKHI